MEKIPDNDAAAYYKRGKVYSCRRGLIPKNPLARGSFMAFLKVLNP
jgi:hypothetical protein